MDPRRRHVRRECSALIIGQRFTNRRREAPTPPPDTPAPGSRRQSQRTSPHHRCSPVVVTRSLDTRRTSSVADRMRRRIPVLPLMRRPRVCAPSTGGSCPSAAAAMSRLVVHNDPGNGSDSMCPFFPGQQTSDSGCLLVEARTGQDTPHECGPSTSRGRSTRSGRSAHG